MYVFTADGYTGELIECTEGELWLSKKIVPELPTWEGVIKFFSEPALQRKTFFLLNQGHEGENAEIREIILY